MENTENGNGNELMEDIDWSIGKLENLGNLINDSSKARIAKTLLLVKKKILADTTDTGNQPEGRQ